MVPGRSKHYLHIYWESTTVVLHVGFPGLCSMCLCPWYLCTFIVINHNGEHDGFVFCELFKGMVKLEGDLGS